jgi:UDPglucose 6-dehydrogenase
MLESMFNTIAGKKIAIFGFAFKADTGDTRDSPAIVIVRSLLDEHANVVISDPKALDNAKEDLQDAPTGLCFELDPYRAAQGANAVALLTDWRLYRELDYERIFQSMEKPAFLFDGRNLLDHKKLFDLGFNVFAIGKAPLTHS